MILESSDAYVGKRATKRTKKKVCQTLVEKRSTRMSRKANPDRRTKKNEKNRSRKKLNEEREQFQGNSIVLVQTL
jgi:hypothetical protein